MSKEKKLRTRVSETRHDAREITIDHIGPIEHLRLMVPKKGGLVVFRGPNGVGKSQALAAVQTLVTGQGRPAPTDGSDRGEVDGLGIVLKVSNRITKSGELEVSSLEGRFSVLDLVEPRIKDADAADGHRIKALIQLTGAAADAALFHKLVGGKKAFGEYVSAGAVDTTDLVTMAAKIKRDLESKARDAEDRAGKERLSAKAQKQMAEGVDVTLPHEQAELSQALEHAVREETRLSTAAEHATDLEQRASLARRSLNQAKEEYRGPSVEEATAARDEASRGVQEQEGVIAELERQLQTARAELRSRSEALISKQEALDTAEQHQSSINALESTIQAATEITEISDEELTAAAAAVAEARVAVERGVTIRNAIEALAKAEQHNVAARGFEAEATKLRDAAHGIDGVLSGVVKKLNSPLRVSKGRLVTDTDRGEELFADLSRGEQWKIALDIAIDAVGEGGLLVIDQTGFEGLDEENQELIAKHLEGSGVVMLTAEATGRQGEELTASVYQAGE